jgi:hypothetical protein
VQAAGGAAVILPSGMALAWGCAIYFVVLFVEVRLARRWNRLYSTVGIPFFVRRLERATGLDGLSLDELRQASSSYWIRNLVFRRLGSDVIAFFQMPIFGIFRRRWMVRGVIRREEYAPAVVVVGLMNWYEVIGTVTAMVLMRGNLWLEPLIVAGFWFANRIRAAPLRRLAAALASSHDASVPIAHHDPQLSQP